MKAPKIGQNAAKMEEQGNYRLKAGIIDGYRFISSKVGNLLEFTSNSPALDNVLNHKTPNIEMEENVVVGKEKNSKALDNRLNYKKAAVEEEEEEMEVK